MAATAPIAHEMIYNGPFILSSWVHGASLEMTRNPDYWDREKIKLDAIKVGYITSEPNALMNFFKDQKIAYTQLRPENIGEAMRQRWRIERFQDGSVFFLEFNQPTIPGHPQLPPAARHATGDRCQRVSEQGHQTPRLPAGQITLPHIHHGRTVAAQAGVPGTGTGAESAEGAGHLQQAKKELGVEEIPPITLLSGGYTGGQDPG